MSEQCHPSVDVNVDTNAKANATATPRKILGRRKRETLLTDLPDDILVKIIHHALQMNPRLPAHLSRRVCLRFVTIGRVICELSQRFYSLMRKSAITCLQIHSKPPHNWLKSMLIFTQQSLTSLHISIDNPIQTTTISTPSSLSIITAKPLDDVDTYDSLSPLLISSRLCLMLASTHPPLRILSISSLSPAPYEHVVSMLLSLPLLKEIDIASPRPLDIAAITHSCHESLTALSLGKTSQLKQVDEIRKQFISLLKSDIGKNLNTLNISWCCATIECFKTIRKNCKSLERLAVELGAMHWIHHRAHIAVKHEGIHQLHIDLSKYAKQQREILQEILISVNDGRLRSFQLRTLDGLRAEDLNLLVNTLNGLSELDLVLGGPGNTRICPQNTFNNLCNKLSPSLKRINMVGIRFSADHVEQFAKRFKKLDTLSVWMERKERPCINVFQALGDRIKHLSLLCDWDANMCKAVGKYNTKLESLFLVTTYLPINSISSLISGLRFTLNEFRLFFNHKQQQQENDDNSDRIHIQIPHPTHQDDEERHLQIQLEQQIQPDPQFHEEAHQQQGNASSDRNAVMDRKDSTSIVLGVARLVARQCSENLEVLNVSAVPREGQVIDCTTISSELHETAPHLYQICDVCVGQVD